MKATGYIIMAAGAAGFLAMLITEHENTIANAILFLITAVTLFAGGLIVGLSDEFEKDDDDG